MSPSKPQTLYTCCLILLALLCARAQALPEDRNANIELQSDQNVFDQKNGLMIWTGNAELKQGSLQIKADKITVRYRDDNTVEVIEATGSPAHLQQQPSANQDVVKASAEEIIYHRLDNTVEMRTSAQLEQNGAVMQGHRVHYDLTREVVQVYSDEAGEERIFMTIPAGSLPE